MNNCWEKIFMLVFTGVMAFANIVTYKTIHHDYLVRTRPYVGIEIDPGNSQEILTNYGPIPAYNVSTLVKVRREATWENVDSVSEMVILPSQKRAIGLKVNISQMDAGTLKMAETLPAVQKELQNRMKPINRIRIECTYTGADKKTEFHSSREFSLDVKNTNEMMIITPIPQGDSAD